MIKQKKIAQENVFIFSYAILNNIYVAAVKSLIPTFHFEMRKQKYTLIIKQGVFYEKIDVNFARKMVWYVKPVVVIINIGISTTPVGFVPSVITVQP